MTQDTERTFRLHSQIYHKFRRHFPQISESFVSVGIHLTYPLLWKSNQTIDEFTISDFRPCYSNHWHVNRYVQKGQVFNQSSRQILIDAIIQVSIETNVKYTRYINIMWGHNHIFYVLYPSGHCWLRLSTISFIL